VTDEHPLTRPPEATLAARRASPQPLLGLGGLVALSLSGLLVLRARAPGGIA
jgi:hypothetical protein